MLIRPMAMGRPAPANVKEPFSRAWKETVNHICDTGHETKGGNEGELMFGAGKGPKSEAKPKEKGQRQRRQG